MDQSWEYCLLPRPDIEYGTNLRLYSVLGTVDAVRSAAMCELGEDGWEYVGQLAKNGEYSDDLLFRRALPSTVPEAERPDVLVIADSPAYDPDSLIRHDDPVIFIGHGHSSAWRDVKDHLVEQHGYLVEAYETGARAGHTVRDILAGALDRARMPFTSSGSFKADWAPTERLLWWKKVWTCYRISKVCTRSATSIVSARPLATFLPQSPASSDRLPLESRSSLAPPSVAGPMSVGLAAEGPGHCPKQMGIELGQP